MMNTQPPDDARWRALQDKVRTLRASDGYKPFLPLVEKLEMLVNVRHEDAEALLRAIEALHGVSTRGGNLRELMDQIVGGFVQPGWRVDTVNQSLGDIVNNNRTVIQIFQGAADKIKILEPHPKTYVPVVLLVMTAQEAQDLVAGTVFAGATAKLKADFMKLDRLLARQGVANWTNRYKTARENWQPFSDAPGAETIGQLITKSLQDLNVAYDYSPPLAPDFKDVVAISRNRLPLQRLRKNGCVVVMDSISMRHPELQRAFQQSMLDAYHNTSVVSIAPVAQAFETARKLTVVLKLRLADMEFAKRLCDRYEYDMCKEISDLQEFERWLAFRVRDMNPPPQAGIHSHMKYRTPDTKKG